MFKKKDKTKERWHKLADKIMPKDACKNAELYTAVVFEDDFNGAKIFKKETLTEKEQKKLCENLKDEYEEQVFKPCRKIFLDFCEKYEIIPIESDLEIFCVKDFKSYIIKCAAKAMADRLQEKMKNSLKEML